MAHHKHPPIARRKLGMFSKIEFALVGTTCARIDGYLNSLFEDLYEEWRVLTVTGDHGEATPGTSAQSGTKKMMGAGEWSELDDRLIGSKYALALVNGNHYPAKRQIVFIDPKKAGTLERRRTQLTDIAGLILIGDDAIIPQWLKDDHPELPPVWTGDWLATFQNLIHNELKAAEPQVKALILTGGKSTRMGTDKAALSYRNGEAEADRLARICRGKGLDTYFSVSAPGDRDNEVVDRFLDLGPMGAIASAFLFDPESAWLVLACDLPLVDETTIQRLLDDRNSWCVATAIRGASKPFPEPLIALYEPRAYARILEFLSIGYACPRKVLINSEVREVVVEDESVLTNANTPEEREVILEKLGSVAR